MFSAPTKVYFTLAGLAVLSGALFVAATGDRSGFTLLVATGLVAAALGVGVFAFVAPDLALPAVAEAGEEAALPPARPAGDGDPPRPSVWPAVGAVALGLLALGLALGKAYLVAGALLAVIVAFAWLAQVWREHPGWTRGMLDRLNDRFIIPIGLPGTVIALIGIGVVSFSRLLLAIDKNAAVLVAMVAALAILFGCAFVASRPELGRSALGGLAAFAAVMLLASGVAGAVKGEREFEVHGDEETIHVKADDLEFDLEELDLKPGHVKIDFENADGVQHNISIYRDGGGEPLFEGEIIAGGEHITYEFDSPPVGKYVFQCDVHPQQMRGTVLVVADSSAGKPPVPANAPKQVED